MESTTIKVGGMTCMGCARSVTKVLQSLPGVAKAEVSLERGEASVQFDGLQIAPLAMKAAIDKAGFEAA